MVAKLIITDYKCPGRVEKGKRFTITFRASNEGDTGEVYYGVYNADTGVALAFDRFVLSAGGSFSINVYEENGISVDMRYKISTGHYLNKETIYQDDYITCEVKVAECTEGATDVLETCWDGSSKREKICVNGKWVEKTYECPPEPECEPEGTTEVLDYCPDGSVKRERKCENGRWREYTYECPPELECEPEGATEVLDYCPNGYDVKRERKCENGRWREYTYDCAECVDGDREVLDFCPDGYNVKRERICENGRWREYTYECPPEAECYEGQEEVLEYCPDGVTVKRIRRCENGKWVVYTYDCPPGPPTEETIIERITRRLEELREQWF